jgi:DNA repair exonuclease SbcCD ATPase subunit
VSVAQPERATDTAKLRAEVAEITQRERDEIEAEVARRAFSLQREDELADRRQQLARELPVEAAKYNDAQAEAMAALAAYLDAADAARQVRASYTDIHAQARKLDVTPLPLKTPDFASRFDPEARKLRDRASTASRFDW